MVKDNSHKQWSEYARNLLEEQNKLKDYFRSSDIAAEIQKMQSYSSGYSSMIQKLQDQIRSSGIAAEIQKMQSYSSGYSSVIQKLQDQIRSSGIAAEIQKMQSYSSGYGSRIQKLQDQIRSSGIAAEIQKMKSYSSGYSSVIQKLQDQIRSSGIAAEIQKMQSHSSSMAAVITRLSEMADDLRNVDYVVNPDGTITGQNSIINQSSVQTIIESYLETAQEADNVGLEIKINNILNDILKHHPVISKIIIIILLPIFIGIFTTIYFSPPVKIDYALLAKQFKNEIRQIEMDGEFYNSYRFVSAKILTVRSKNWTKSRCVGKLYFGNLVRVIQKKKNWALIEYRDKEGNIIVKGWVFTRYIKRLD